MGLCVQGFSPMNKYGLQTVMKLASCYGLKSSAQGSGKKQFVVVRFPRSCLLTTMKGGLQLCTHLCQHFSVWIRRLQACHSSSVLLERWGQGLALLELSMHVVVGHGSSVPSNTVVCFSLWSVTHWKLMGCVCLLSVMDVILPS